MVQGAWQATSMRLQRIRHDWLFKGGLRKDCLCRCRWGPQGTLHQWAVAILNLEDQREDWLAESRRVWQTSPAFEKWWPPSRDKATLRGGSLGFLLLTRLPPLIFPLPFTFPPVSCQGPHYPNPPRSQVAKRLVDEGETSQSLLQRAGWRKEEGRSAETS